MKNKTQKPNQGYYNAGDRITITLTEDYAAALSRMRERFCAALEIDPEQTTNNWPADTTILNYTIGRAYTLAAAEDAKHI